MTDALMVGGHDLAAPRAALRERGNASLGAVSESPVGSNATVASTHHPSACPDCQSAEQHGATWGGFRSGCRGCCARSIARDPSFHASREAGTLTRKYRALLEQIGGLCSPAVSHDEVRQWAERDARAREVAA